MILDSLLDNDLYKFTMMQAVLHQFPDAEVEYKFASRNHISYLDCIYEINEQINHLCTLRFTPQDLLYLSGLRYIKPDFIEFLRLFQFNRDFVKVTHERSASGLSIKIKGPWLHTILFEVPILAIVSEVYSRNNNDRKTERIDEKITERIDEKINIAKTMPKCIADFGTRRRHSFRRQNYVIGVMTYGSKNILSGTSNVFLAKRYGIKPIGTMAHEWIQAGQGLGVRIRDSQKFMLENWVQEYRGDLGIALTDTIGVDAFLKDFDLYFAKLYDGVRHDSGDPYEFGTKIINHYKNMGIDPLTKTIVFSDGLTFPKAKELYEVFAPAIGVAFGIGTNLTNNLVDPPQIVIKMTRCNGQPVAKISDNPEKGMCEDKEYVNYLKKVFDV